MTLVPIEKNAPSVVSMLEKAKTWLATAVATTGPEEITAAKAQIRTAEVYAKELGLSKDIQDDATEMVRRAEYALSKSIRLGQAAGTIAQRHVSRPFHGLDDVAHPDIKKVTDFVNKSEWTGGGNDHVGISALADVDEDAFDEAVDQARDEGNLSRANVVRKVKGQAGQHQTRDQRADLIVKLANKGLSSRQMPSKVGVSEETVRQIARDYGIEIPADRSVGRSRRANSTQIVVQTATALEGLVMGVDQVDFDALDLSEVSQWAASLKDSTKKLAGFAEQIRKATQ